MFWDKNTWSNLVEILVLRFYFDHKWASKLKDFFSWFILAFSCNTVITFLKCVWKTSVHPSIQKKIIYTPIFFNEKHLLGQILRSIIYAFFFFSLKTVSCLHVFQCQKKCLCKTHQNRRSLLNNFTTNPASFGVKQFSTTVIQIIKVIVSTKKYTFASFFMH